MDESATLKAFKNNENHALSGRVIEPRNSLPVCYTLSQCTPLVSVVVMGAGLYMYAVSGKGGKSEGRSEWRPCQGKMGSGSEA